MHWGRLGVQAGELIGKITGRVVTKGSKSVCTGQVAHYNQVNHLSCVMRKHVVIHKGVDQPWHIHNLISSTFVVSCLNDVKFIMRCAMRKPAHLQSDHHFSVSCLESMTYLASLPIPMGSVLLVYRALNCLFISPLWVCVSLCSHVRQAKFSFVQVVFLQGLWF